MILTYILSIKFRNSQINFDHDTYPKIKKKMATISYKIGYTHMHWDHKIQTTSAIINLEIRIQTLSILLYGLWL